MTNLTTLEGMLKSLNLSTFVQNYQPFAEQTETAQHTHLDYLYRLAEFELDKRTQKRIKQLLKQSKLPRDKHLHQFEVARIEGLSPSLIQRLAQGEFIDRQENLLLFGNPGTGKTHLSIALAREWCLLGRKVLYTTAAGLVQELLAAKNELKLNPFIKKLDRFEIIVIDDISYVPYQREETDVLFILLAERYEKRSVLVTSNLVFSQWGNVFKDEMTTAAAIDRLVHHAIIIELNAASYRSQQAAKRQQDQRQLASSGDAQRQLDASTTDAQRQLQQNSEGATHEITTKNSL